MNELESILPLIKFTPSRGFNGSRVNLTYGYEIPKILFFADWKHRGKSVGLRKYPHIYEIIKTIIKEFDPTFEYNIIQINKNVRCKPHTDKKNKGSSLIFTLGDFTDGNLVIENISHNIYKNPIYIDGHKQSHWTEEFTGERFSIICYRSSIANSIE